jgi:ubiquinone biosynthesis protein UbiJ
MLHSLASLLAPAVAERLTLMANHLLGAEAVACEKLRPHAGRTLVLKAVNWPSLLPPPPALAWRVTPAGLLEWCGTDVPTTADLSALIEAGNPALVMGRMLLGDRPAVQIEGDAQFAADVNWLLANLRWDVAGDLENVFGSVVAGQLQQLGSAVASALRAAVAQAAGLTARWRPTGKPGPS